MIDKKKQKETFWLKIENTLRNDYNFVTDGEKNCFCFQLREQLIKVDEVCIISISQHAKKNQVVLVCFYQRKKEFQKIIANVFLVIAHLEPQR